MRDPNVVILHRYVYDGEGNRLDQSEHIDSCNPGDIICIWVAAPGSGKILYEVSHVDEKGVWGFVVKDTSSVDVEEDIEF